MDEATQLDRGRLLASDPRDKEIERLKKERDDLLAREERARSEAKEARARLSEFASRSRAFAATMSSQATERRRARQRILAQYQIGRALEDSRSLEEAAPKVFGVLAEVLGFDRGVLWRVDAEAGVLRCAGIWDAGERRVPEAFVRACEGARPARGEGLPGRVWESGQVLVAQDISKDAPYRGDPRREELVEEGLKGSLAFPVRDGGNASAVFEIFCREAPNPDEDLARTMYIIGHQIGQFVERRRAEEARRDFARRLEQQARIFDTTLTSITDFAYIFDKEGRFTYSNRALLELLGITLDEIVGKNFFDLNYPEDLAAKLQRQIQHVFDTKEVVVDETPFTSQTGAGGYFEYIFSPVVAADGTVDVVAGSTRDITEHKRSEEELRESEARYRRLFTSIDEGFMFGEAVLDAEGRPVDFRYLEVNPAYKRMTGTTENVIGKTGREVIPNLEEEWIEVVGRVALGGETVRIEQRAAGLNKWFNAYFSPVGEKGSGRLVAVFTDVTPHREAEEALRESEERLRAVVSGAPVILFALDKDGVFTLSEGRGLEVLGAHPNEVVGRSIFEVYAGHPEILADVRRALSGESSTGDAPVGGVVFETQYAPIQDEGGEVTGVIGIATDVTERKQAERERDRFFDLSPDLLCVSDFEGRFKRINPAFESTLGYTAEEFFERPYVDFVHPEDREETLKELGSLKEGGSTFRLETRVLCKDGTQRWMLWTAIPVVDEGVMYKAGRDITELKNAEEEREQSLAREWRSRAQAEERKRLSRELHDRVAHSIAVVHQSLELHEALKERNPAGAQSRMEVAREMTREALNYTRDLSNKLRNPEVEGGLSAALSNLLSTTLPPHLECEVSFEGDESLVPPRTREQLFLILREAIRNTVAHAGASHLKVGVHIDEEAGVVTVYVEDDGQGLDGDSSPSGSGLFSMRERAELLGGSLELESTPGAGTRVEATISLEEGT